MSAWVNSKRWSKAWQEVESIVGGGQGVTKKVQSSLHGEKEFFLKELLPKLRKNNRARQRFLREAQAYQGFKHSRIPELVEANAQIATEDWSYEPYFVTNLISGENLEDFIKDRGTVSLGEAINLAEGLLEVLSYLHSEGCIHRDIKPRNIVLRLDQISDPVLVDFGISYHAEAAEGVTLIGEELGNRFLRLPELSSQSTLKQDERSDVAFVGGIVFYALTGIVPGVLLDETSRLPHQRGDAAQLILSAAGGKASSLMSFFDRAFSYDINGRFSNAQEMASELARIDQMAPSDSEDSIEKLKAQISERINSAKNKKLASNMSIKQTAVNTVTTTAAEVVTEVGGGIYWPINKGANSSNTSQQINFGYYHSGDQSKQFVPSVRADIVGTHLVVSIANEEILRAPIESAKFDEVFKDKVRTIYLRGLKSLTDNE